MPSWAALVLEPQALLREEGDQDWYYRVYEWRNAQILQTQHSPSLADFSQRTGTPSRVSLENLVRPRAGWRKAGRAWLLQSGRPDAFEFRPDEQFGTVEVLEEVARSCGGDHLLAWTYGGSAQVLLFRSPAPGARPAATRASFRVEPDASGRPPRAVARLRAALEGSPLPVDPGRLEALLGAPRLDLAAWFAALGAKGVVEVDPGAAWDDLQEAARLLLAGAAVPAPLLKRVNGHLPKERQLKSKPAGKPGATARLVAEAAVALARAVGPGWEERFRAAALAGAIAGGEALGRLTAGRDRAGLGASASFGRLLAHYPPGLLRDPLFHALSGLQTEAANGHPYVPAWFCLAENTARAGFTLAVYPAARAGSFRKAFGIEAAEEEVVREGWCGEAFVDLPGLLKAEPGPALEAWFAREGCEGLVARAEPDGRCDIRRFPGPAGAPPPPEPLSRAAASLDARGLLAALGLPDVLEPGALGRASAAGTSSSSRRDCARRLLEGTPEPEPVEDLGILHERFRVVDSGLSFEDLATRKEPTLACRLAFPRDEDAEALLQDLQRLELFQRQAPWRDGAEVWLAGHVLQLGLLAGLAGDVPAGTRVAFTARPALALRAPGLVRFHYEVSP